MSAKKTTKQSSSAQGASMTDFSDIFKAWSTAFTNPLSEENPFAKWTKTMGVGSFDPQKLMSEHQGRLEALARANQQAAEAYQAHVQRQVEIFDTMMKAAQDVARDMDMSGTPDAAAKNMAVYSEAMEKSTQLMQRLSEETAAAAEEAYRNITSEVEAATRSLYSK